MYFPFSGASNRIANMQYDPVKAMSQMPNGFGSLIVDMRTSTSLMPAFPDARVCTMIEGYDLSKFEQIFVLSDSKNVCLFDKGYLSNSSYMNIEYRGMTFNSAAQLFFMRKCGFAFSYNPIPSITQIAAEVYENENPRYMEELVSQIEVPDVWQSVELDTLLCCMVKKFGLGFSKMTRIKEMSQKLKTEFEFWNCVPDTRFGVGMDLRTAIVVLQHNGEKRALNHVGELIGNICYGRCFPLPRFSRAEIALMDQTMVEMHDMKIFRDTCYRAVSGQT